MNPHREDLVGGADARHTLRVAVVPATDGSAALRALAHLHWHRAITNRVEVALRALVKANVLAHPRHNPLELVNSHRGHVRIRLPLGLEQQALPPRARHRRRAQRRVHRHLAQLALTREMFVRENKTLKLVGDLGVEQQVDGLLLYVNDEGAEFFVLDDWWKKKAPLILRGL